MIVGASAFSQSLFNNNATMALFLITVVIILLCNYVFLCLSTAASEPSIGRDKDKGPTLPTRYVRVLLR